MAFSGTFDYTLDAKNRLTVPAKFRASLSGAVVLARSSSAACITIWPKGDFDTFVNSALEGFGPLDPERDKINRYFFSNSFETELDSAGRVMVPPKLMAHARLSKDVVVNGLNDRIEVWDRATWSEFNDNLTLADLTSANVHPS